MDNFFVKIIFAEACSSSSSSSSSREKELKLQTLFGSNFHFCLERCVTNASFVV